MEPIILDMVKFSKIGFFIIVSSFVLCCKSSIYTYYCKENNMSFQMIEKDTCDILVIGTNDSIYLPCSNGQYMGLQFYTKEDSNIVFFELTNSYPVVYRYVEDRYKIKLIQFDHYKDMSREYNKLYDAHNIVFRYAGKKYDNPYENRRECKDIVKELCFDNHCLSFFGNGDQGRYTFSVFRDTTYISLLEPSK